MRFQSATYRNITTSPQFNEFYSYTYNHNFPSGSITLPLITSTEIGATFLITNVSTISLDVYTSDSQTIYSSTSSSSSISFSHGQGSILTAIQDSSSSYGWVMI